MHDLSYSYREDMSRGRRPAPRQRAKVRCWCYICCGRPRQPRTLATHADRPRFATQLAVHEYDAHPSEADINAHQPEEKKEDSDESCVSAFAAISHLLDPVCSGENQPSLGVVLITVLDLMTKHKATDAIAKDIIAFLNSFVPSENNLPTFSLNLIKVNYLVTPTSNI